MKLRSLLCAFAAFLIILTTGCTSSAKVIVKGKNYSFTDDMAVYMINYTMSMYKDELEGEGADLSKPLSEQYRKNGDSFADYVFDLTVDTIEKVLLYCEASAIDGYTVDEGMYYKSTDNLNYLSSIASEEGLTSEEYLKKYVNEKLTLRAYQTCVEMMALCEGFESHLMDNKDVSHEDASAYADENPKDFLLFNCLRYSTKDADIVSKLEACTTSEEFAGVVSSVSGINRTDSDKNTVPDMIEFFDLVVSSDISGEFACAEGRAAFDIHTIRPENDDEAYTVTMLLDLPERNTSPAWDFRLIYLASETYDNPLEEAESLLEQWKEKEGGEAGFSDLAARYSDHPSAYYGGIYNGATRSGMPSSDIGKWVCSTDRIAGDTTVISEGDSGVYMLYYIGGPAEAWLSDAQSAVKVNYAREQIDEKTEEILDSLVWDKDALRELIN